MERCSCGGISVEGTTTGGTDETEAVQRVLDEWQGLVNRQTGLPAAWRAVGIPSGLVSSSRTLLLGPL